jgi:hypothetical protein
VREHTKDNFLMIIGIGSLFIGIFDCLHMLAYKGMPIFNGFDADLPTQLWIIARFFQVGSIVLAISFSNRKVNTKLYFSLYIIASIIFLLLTFVFKNFPNCFIEGSGLTPFKIYTEIVYVIILSSVLIYILSNKGNKINEVVRYNFMSYLILTIISEICFTLYTDVTGIENFIGHIFKFLAVGFLYSLVNEFAIITPVQIIFNKLEKRNKELEKALGQIERFKGIVSVCSWCNKVEDATGKWITTDSFIDNYAETTHGVCDKCYNNLTKETDETQ